MKKKILIIALMLISVSGFAEDKNRKYHDRTTPKLVVVINAEQFRYDYLSRFGKNFGQGGIKRMMNEGVSCTNARYNYMFTQSSPGIATIMTGTQPSQHGIIGDGWVNYTTNQKIAAAIDESQKGIGCNEDEGCYSPKNLLVSTIGDELKKHYPAAKVMSASLSPESAVFAGGKRADGAYWFDVRYGGWATSMYYMNGLPKWINDYNSSNIKVDYASKLWHISRPFDNYVYKQNSVVLLDSVVKFSFDIMFKPKNNNEYSRLQETPYGNSYLTDFAINMIDKEALGADNTPDMLILNYGIMRHLSGSYGIESMEVEDALYRFDDDIAKLLYTLDSKIGTANYVVVFTTNHGSSDNISEEKFGGGKFNAMQFRVLIGGFLNTQLGVENWVSEYRNKQIYLNRRLIFERGLSLTDIQNKVATFALQFGGVAQSVTAMALQNNYYGKSIMQKIQNSFFPKHSGDVIINLLPGWIELEGGEGDQWLLSSGGSPYEYDTHVPLIWCGGNMVNTTVHSQIDMTDVAPTISEILGIPYPNASEGTAINEIIEELK